MIYAIAIHKDDDSDYGVTVPDLPGCFSAGQTLHEALAMAKEAIELHLEGMIEDGEAVPDASDVEVYQKDSAYKGALWALIDIDPASLPQKAKRINITMPERMLSAADRFADHEGLTRSGLITRSVAAYIGPKRAAAKYRVVKGTSGKAGVTRRGAARDSVKSKTGKLVRKKH